MMTEFLADITVMIRTVPIAPESPLRVAPPVTTKMSSLGWGNAAIECP